MSLAPFLSTLLREGRARVEAPPAGDAGTLDEPGAPRTPEELGEAADDPALDELLRELYAAAVEELADAAPAPALDLPAARWGARTLYRLCRAIPYPASEPGSESTAGGPAPHSPAAALSVDLCLRYLPELERLTRGLARDDPSRARLFELARAWPLSSVGTPGVGAVDARPLAESPALARLYVDRALERADPQRLDDPRLVALAQEALGDHPELGPRLPGSSDRAPES